MKIEVNERFLQSCIAFFTEDELSYIRDEFLFEDDDFDDFDDDENNQFLAYISSL